MAYASGTRYMTPLERPSVSWLVGIKKGQPQLVPWTRRTSLSNRFGLWTPVQQMSSRTLYELPWWDLGYRNKISTVTDFQNWTAILTSLVSVLNHSPYNVGEILLRMSHIDVPWGCETWWSSNSRPKNLRWLAQNVMCCKLQIQCCALARIVI